MKNNIEYNQDEEPIVLSKYVLDLLLSQPKSGHLIALYCFYYYTAKWQKTNQPKATTEYVAQGLDCTVEFVRKYKAALVTLKLIEDFQRKDESGKITGHFIKINFIWTKEKLDSICKGDALCKMENSIETTLRKTLRVVSREANALSSNNKNFVGAKDLFNNKISPVLFPDFWKIYPKKTDQGKAKTAWNKLCKKKDRPEWDSIRKAISLQKESERWQDKTFIPMPTTWINQSRWLDSPEEMIVYKRTNNTTMRPPKIWDGMHYNFDPSDGLYKNRAGDSWIN